MGKGSLAPIQGPLEEFRQVAAGRGLIITEKIVPGGAQWQRCAVKGGHQSNKDGSYLISPDGLTGRFENHADGQGCVTWEAAGTQPRTQLELLESARRMRAFQEAIAAADAARHAEAAEEAKELWRDGSNCKEHPYTTRKQVDPVGLKTCTKGYHKGQLMAAFYDAHGAISTLQLIDDTGAKKFLAGGKKKGCYAIVGEPTDAIRICEGWATGASIHAVTGDRVFVAGDCGNLLPVAQVLRSKHPSQKIIICGDDDWRTANNPGRTQAEAAAKAINAQAVFPVFGPDRGQKDTDFNDLAVSQGLEATRSCLTPRRRLKTVSWDTLRQKPVEPLSWIVNGLLPRVTFGLIASQSGHGKSMFTIQAAVAVATGLPVLGFETGAPSAVVLLSLEDDVNVIHRRIAAAVAEYPNFTEEHHQLLGANLKILVRPTDHLQDLSPEMLDTRMAVLEDEIVEAMQSCKAPPALVVVDTVNAVHDGDENSSQETRPLVAAFFRLQARLGCAVYALHHLRKAGNQTSRTMLSDRMDADLVRGSSAIVASARAVLQFGWITAKEAEKAGLDSENCTRRYGILGLSKMNDGRASPWLLMQHSDHAGLWEPVLNGESILAQLKGKQAVAKLKVTDAILIEISQLSKLGILDMPSLAAKCYPKSRNPAAALRKTISRFKRDGLLGSDNKVLPMGKARIDQIRAEQKTVVGTADSDEEV